MELAAQRQLIRQPERRDPQRADAWVFFILTPLAMAVVLSMIGNRLIMGMDYLDGLGYMTLHMLLAWWSVSAGAWSARYLCRRWQPRAASLVGIGFLVSLVPTALLFQALGDIYADLYAAFADNRRQTVMPELSLRYGAHFLRYSLPAVPLFLAGVIGYRYVTGVDWLGYPQRQHDPTGSRATVDAAAAVAGRANRSPRAGRLPRSGLPDTAVLIAIKAEQHYVRVWSDQGVDFLRYRFRDLGSAFHDCDAAPVHRSWWVNFDRVAQTRRAGRSIELVMDNGVVVPVSLSHKAAVLDAVGQLRGGHR